MSAPAAAAAPASLQQLDALIARVEAMPTGAPAAGKQAGGAKKQAANAAAPAGASSVIPTETKDVRWWPVVPLGHTRYTFFGVDDTNPQGVATSALAASAAPAAAAAPQPQAGGEKKPAAEKKPKATKPAKAANAPKTAAAKEPDQPDFSKLDIRVGQIVSAARHPKPEVTSLYVEMIDVGEAEPRQIVSGLVNYIPLEQFQTMRCLVVCNLKPSPLQGVVSHGMVLAASVGEGDERRVELVQPPAGAKPGDRVHPLDSSVDWASLEPMAQVDSRKKDKKTGQPDNPWSRTAQTLRTDANKVATWDGKPIGTAAGPAIAPSLANASIA